ncbi:glycosyltransferase [Winogradskyella algicola]|uniref:glycosyltransferase n=1 Tax=Winogradskyella algicola TaxID=2575815 RepID=UPI0011096DE2|nr:glycosyltransferase [Winogradskyella algicola]
MRIVQVIDRLEVGGAERVLVDLTNLLHESEYNVSVICLLQEGQLDAQLASEIPITYIRRKHKFNPIYLFKLYKELVKYDIIHIHLRQVLRYVSLLFYFTRLNNNKVIIFHDHFGKIAQNKSISYSLKLAIKKCTAYIGVSRELVSWAKETRLNANIYKLANVIRKKETRVNSLRSHNDNIEVVAVGNFRPQKNYEYLLDVIKDSPSNYNFTIYGQSVDNAYFEKIKAQIEKFNIVDKVTIITDCKDIKTQLHKYDIGIHTAKSETGPLVAIEYLSENLPFIAYNTGEVADKIKFDFQEFIQNDFEVTNWLKQMDNLVKTKKEMEIKIELFYNQNFSEESYLKSCISIYQELLNPTKKHS